MPASVLKVLDRVLSEAIEGVSSSLREAALIDPLTGCANRRALSEDLERAVAGARPHRSRCRRGGDRPRRVEADQRHPWPRRRRLHASRPVADSLKSAVRDTDAVYRVGGDEFVVLIPFSGTGGAAAAMQRAKAEGAPTFSWGAASLSMLPAGSDVDKLIELADASLYATRRNVRPITSARPRRHRTALVGAAAAAVVGLGVSSAFVLPSSPQQAAIGAPAPKRHPRRRSGWADVSVATPDLGPVALKEKPPPRLHRGGGDRGLGVSRQLRTLLSSPRHSPSRQRS